MSTTVICGINWGDEGKGRMTDYFAKDADIVVRYQGGNNAGHTVVNEFGTFKLHLIPSGIFYDKVLNILGPGMVIDIEAFWDELTELSNKKIDISKKIKISDRATICFPFNRLEDELEEERLSDNAYGSTKRGIAPAYSDRVLKKSFQIGELFNLHELKKELDALISYKNLIIKNVYGKDLKIDADETMGWLEHFGAKIKPFICNISSLLNAASAEGKNILLEAQLGVLKDVIYGIYPFTSSSCTLASYAPIGSGFFKEKIDKVVGVMKAFSTCVGAGPFVTEIHGDVSDNLREIAFEYGAATGRPRRIGYFDAVASRYGVNIQNPDEIALTKLDCLTGQKELFICTGYIVEGSIIDEFPLNSVLEKALPHYIKMKAWDEDITDCRKFDDLPHAAKDYVAKIEELIKHPVKYISVGPERGQLIIK